MSLAFIFTTTLPAKATLAAIIVKALLTPALSSATSCLSKQLPNLAIFNKDYKDFY
jgi:hypothetical protein